MSEALTDLIKRYLEERSAYLFEKDAEAMFLVTIGRYKGARLGCSVDRAHRFNYSQKTALTNSCDNSTQKSNKVCMF